MTAPERRGLPAPSWPVGATVATELPGWVVAEHDGHHYLLHEHDGVHRLLGRFVDAESPQRAVRWMPNLGWDVPAEEVRADEWASDMAQIAVGEFGGVILVGPHTRCENCGRLADLHPHVPDMQVCDVCDPDDAANRPEPPA